MDAEQLNQAAVASAAVAKGGATVGLGTAFYTWVTANATFLTGLAGLLSIIAVPCGLILNWYFKHRAHKLEAEKVRAEIKDRERRANNGWGIQ